MGNQGFLRILERFNLQYIDFFNVIKHIYSFVNVNKYL